MTAANAVRSNAASTRTIRARLVGGLMTAILLVAVPAWAITAGEVLDKMSEDERFGYITGSVDTAMYLAAVQEKNNAKSECILNWYYGKNAAGPKQVIDMFRRYRDKPAIALIKVLIDRACPAK